MQVGPAGLAVVSHSLRSNCIGSLVFRVFFRYCLRAKMKAVLTSTRDWDVMDDIEIHLDVGVSESEAIANTAHHCTDELSIELLLAVSPLRILPTPMQVSLDINRLAQSLRERDHDSPTKSKCSARKVGDTSILRADTGCNLTSRPDMDWRRGCSFLKSTQAASAASIR